MRSERLGRAFSAFFFAFSFASALSPAFGSLALARGRDLTWDIALAFSLFFG